MDDGRDSLLAHALRLGLVVACVIGLAILATAVEGPLATPVRAGAAFDPATLNIELLGGLALVAAGVVMVAAAIERRLAGLVTIVGVELLLAAARMDRSVPPALVAPVAAVLAATSALILVLQVEFVAATGSRSRPHPILAGIFVAAAIVAVVSLVTYDPFYDVSDAGAIAPAWIPVSQSAHLWLGGLADLEQIVIGAAAIVVAARWLAVARDRTRPIALVVVGAALLLLPSVATAAGLHSDIPGETTPRAVAHAAVQIAGAAGLVALTVGLWWWVIGTLQLRVRMERAELDIAVATGGRSVNVALTEALGQGPIDVVFPLPDSQDLVGATGSPATPDGWETGRGATFLDQHGALIAIIRHPADLDTRVVRERLAPSLRVAIDNERLRAVSLANLRLLRESRTRIVVAQDAERRRVERDLHDGAQQRLLAVAMDLRLAGARAERAGEAGAATRLLAAETLASGALEELRRLARGLHPAILTQGGLGPALSSLAEDAAIPLTLDVDRATRLPALVEAIAYQAVVETLADAGRRGATDMAVTVHPGDGEVAIEIEFDGAAPGMPQRLVDRVGAAGGEVTVEASGLDRHRIRAVMPCG